MNDTDQAQESPAAPPTPRQIKHKITLASSALSAGVGIGLGMWCGLGDWASLTDKGKLAAGRRALDDLDQVLEELVAARTELAAAVGDEPGGVDGE